MYVLLHKVKGYCINILEYCAHLLAKYQESRFLELFLEIFLEIISVPKSQWHFETGCFSIWGGVCVLNYVKEV